LLVKKGLLSAKVGKRGKDFLNHHMTLSIPFQSIGPEKPTKLYTYIRKVRYHGKSILAGV
jgi:hypothetical protein